MEWSALSILNANLVKKEVDAALFTLKKFVDENHPKLPIVIEAIKTRIGELEVFFSSNDDGIVSLLLIISQFSSKNGDAPADLVMLSFSNGPGVLHPASRNISSAGMTGEDSLCLLT